MGKNNIMIKNEYKRCLFSRATIVYIIALLAVTFINYYYSFMTKSELLGQLSSGAQDLNIENLQLWIDSYNGFKFFFSFYNRSDELSIAVLLIYAWIGIFVSGVLSKQRESGYGNWLVMRCGYTRYARTVLRAESLYIATVNALVFLLQLVTAFAIGGAKTLFYDIGTSRYNVSNCVLLILVTYLLLTFYSITVNIIASSCIWIVKGSYFIQLLPVMVFCIIPLLLFSTLANVFSWPQFFADVLIPFNYLSNIYQILNTFYLDELVAMITSIILFATIAVSFMRISIRRMEREYI